ncbi:MAG: anhydro-N-acetylmuramic acid kinase [Microscillaceae bacterium]|nr:anhydro-N-acetylmuramic acid kinase [Microscillaceae bacterium]
MSGTSLDGLDLALCHFAGWGTSLSWQVEKAVTIPYPAEIQTELRTVFAQAQAGLEKICLLHARLGQWYAQTVGDTLAAWDISPQTLDAIASHGQTIYHAPCHQHGQPKQPNASLQIGDADRIAFQTGVITLADFRQKHLAAGGEGAPLAVYGDYHLFFSTSENRFLLNIGGIANFTYLPAGGKPTQIQYSDTGPGNTLIDAAMRKWFAPSQYDENGQTAQRGKINLPLLAQLKMQPFFAKPLPKTTGGEVFYLQWAESQAQRLSLGPILPEDWVATLSQLTIETVARAIQETALQGAVYVSGGGVHNRFLMEGLQRVLPDFNIRPLEALGVSSEAKEALLFAFLAYRTIRGDATDFGLGLPSVSFGKISLPY